VQLQTRDGTGNLRSTFTHPFGRDPAMQRPNLRLGPVALPSSSTPPARLCWLMVCLFASSSLAARAGDSQPTYLPDVRFHLTARPWEPVNAPKSDLLDHLDAAMHALAPLQYWNEHDPADKKNGA